ncbi:MAG TPA: redoxin domain-containing protein [Bacteroidales bacterium]|nr:redoxin domain-containing protein [Bacteroidales bacterium]
MRYFKYLLLLFFFGLTAYVPMHAQAKTIPEFSMFTREMTLFTNKDLNKDKPLFFLFFDVKCEHCLHAVQTLNKNYKKLDAAQVYLVTLDRPEDAESFLKTNGKNLLDKDTVMLLFDLNKEFIVKFLPKKYPSIFLYTNKKTLVKYDDNPSNLPVFFDKIAAESKAK